MRELSDIARKFLKYIYSQHPGWGEGKEIMVSKMPEVVCIHSSWLLLKCLGMKYLVTNQTL